MNTFRIIDQCDFIPDISIAMLAYNHEKFIVDAIESILMQKTSYTYKIIIAEDCSTDGTRKIILEYQKKYPDKFKLILQNENVGASKNNLNLLTNLEGKYIAALEGDDYWTDPNKLQKQVDFLEANEDYVIHSGNARILSNDSSNASMVLKTTSDSVFEIDHFYKNNNIITCTVLFRNQTIDFPDFFNKIIFGDWFLYVILMFKTKQKVYLSSELFSVYRVHSGGVMSNLSKEKNLLAHVFQIKSIQKYIGNRFYSKDIERKLNYYYLEIFLLRCYDENYKNALLILFENLKSCFKTFPIKSYFGFLKLFIFKKINQSKK